MANNNPITNFIDASKNTFQNVPGAPKKQADWYPQQTGNTQYDENQRKVWENLYYLRDQNNNAAPSTAPAGGMSGTAFFAGGFTMTSGPTGKTYYRMIIQEGRIVGIS